jgi:hypothetical protein
MQFNKIIPYTFLLLSLSGCVPNAVRYYRPTVDGGKLLKPRCVPTESIVEFRLPGANGRLHVRAWANNGKHVNQISLFFSGKAWKTIQFESTNFQIHDLEKHVITDASSVLAYISDSTSNLATKPYLAPPERPGLFRFHVQINSSDPLPSTFELIVPSIVVDGETIAFPSIRFEQKQWLGVSPLNC